MPPGKVRRDSGFEQVDGDRLGYRRIQGFRILRKLGGQMAPTERDGALGVDPRREAHENLCLWTHRLVECGGAFEHRASGAAEGRFVGIHVLELHASQPTEVAADLGAALGGPLRERVRGHC